jgi:NhaP-type Na+/H+ or K+/H+ antiporter
MEFLIGVVVGFVLGYGVREAMSRYRRSHSRREREHEGPP